MNAPLTEDDINPNTDLGPFQMIAYTPSDNAGLRATTTNLTLGQVIGEGQAMICFLSLSWLKANKENPDAWQHLNTALQSAQEKGIRVFVCMTHYCRKVYERVFAQIPEAFTLHGTNQAMQIYWLDSNGRASINLGDDPMRVFLLDSGSPILSSEEDTPYNIEPILTTLDKETARLSA